MDGKRRRAPKAEPKLVVRRKSLKKRGYSKQSMLEVSWQGKCSGQYLKLILVNFSPATFSYAHRIFLDKVRPDNVLLLAFLHI